VALTALRGALGFLSRLPVGHDEAAWNAFRATPTSFPLAGYVVGALAALPLLAPAPAPTVALGYVAGVYLLTGVTHADGLADCGDAAAVHGDAARRREVLEDSDVGTGGALAVGVAVVGLALAGLALAGVGPSGWTAALAAAVVVAAEVGAKLGMATLVCRGTAPHEGLGSSLTGASEPRALWRPAALAVPAALAGWPVAAATGVGGPLWALPTAAAVVAAVGVALVVGRWADRSLGGVSGDVLGAANELGRVAALHAGALAWSLGVVR